MKGYGKMIKNMGSLIIRYKRVLLFLVIGGINTAVDFLVFTAADQFMALAVEYNQACGYIAGLISSYILNQAFTFRDAEKTGSVLKIARFLIVNAVSLGISMYGIKLLTLMGLNRYFAKVIITIVTMAINYIGYKLFVFRVKER